MVEENKKMEDIGSLKEKLLAVSNEIDAIKNSFSKSTEELSRIQSMLSVGEIEDISGTIEQFETRVAEAEKQKMEATEGARKYSEELEKEKERLIKLWDAYKNQEEELSTAERKVNEYEERTRVAEASKKQLEDDLTARIDTLTQKLQEYEGKATSFDEYKQKCEEFDDVRNQLEREIHDLKEQNTAKDNLVNDLNQQLKELTGKEDFSQFKEKFEEINAEYEKEKERLTKLYQLYEETESECKQLKEEKQNWQNWYNSNKEIFSKLFSGAPPMETHGNPTPPPENPIERKPDKAKKKLRFRK